jgi:hypothetical protein
LSKHLKAANPVLSTLRMLAEIAHTSVSFLIGETDDPSPIRVEAPASAEAETGAG